MTRTYKWFPVIEEELCTGCGACVEACGPRCLALVGKIALLSHPYTCGSEEHCIVPCLDEATRMAWVRVEGDGSREKWKEAQDA